LNRGVQTLPKVENLQRLTSPSIGNFASVDNLGISPTIFLGYIASAGIKPVPSVVFDVSVASLKAKAVAVTKLVSWIVKQMYFSIS
jgi:hypothetical protein